jgi:hypothetical protein
MTCEIRPFEPAHFEGLEIKSVFHKKEDIRPRLAAVLHRPDSYLKTAIIADKPVAILGLIQTWPGVAEVWSVASEDVRQAPISYTRQVKRLMEEFAGNLKIHRLQMTVRRDYREGSHWAAVLGFRNEGILRQYGPDKSDYLMFARVS